MINIQNVKPRYEVERIAGTVRERRVERKAAPGGGTMNAETWVDVPYGFHVYFPAGHSIRVATEAELARLGFNAAAELIDMESGDTVGVTGQMTLKRQIPRRSAHARADTSGVDAEQGD